MEDLEPYPCLWGPRRAVLERRARSKPSFVYIHWNQQDDVYSTFRVAKRPRTFPSRLASACDERIFLLSRKSG